MQVRAQSGFKDALPALGKRRLPEGEKRDLAVVLLVAAPDVVDEQVQPIVIGGDAREDRFDLRVVAVVTKATRPSSVFTAPP